MMCVFSWHSCLPPVSSLVFSSSTPSPSAFIWGEGRGGFCSVCWAVVLAEGESRDRRKKKGPGMSMTLAYPKKKKRKKKARSLI